MKKYTIPFLLFLILACIAATVVTPGKKVSEYPNKANPPDAYLYLLTEAGVTNWNITHAQLRLNLTNGLATTNYVNSITNGLATTNYVNAATNGIITRFEIQTNTVQLGFVTNINWTFGMTGSLSSQTAILGVDDSLSNSNLSNSIFGIITNSAIVTSNTFAFNRTNQFTTNVAGTPVNGRLWVQGFEGRPFITNNARSKTFEWDPTNQSVRIGSVGDDGPQFHAYLQSTNYWDNPNLGYLSYAFGSNNLVNAQNSTIAGGSRNLIYTNAGASFIGGGTNNVISTNSYGSVICGGGFGSGGGIGNVIEVNSFLSFIGGGSEHRLKGGNQHGVIVGGQQQTIVEGAHSFVGGGLSCAVGVTGAGAGANNYSAVVGGRQNGVRGAYGFVGGGRENSFLDNAAIGGGDYNVICGGASNNIGVVNFPSKFCFVGGGHECDIANGCDYGVIVGGANNSLSGSNTNSFIGGGRFNSIGANKVFASILGGERNTVNGNYGVAIGTSNTVSADYGIAIGTGINVSSAGKVVIANVSSYTTSSTIAGAGNGNTNYTLQSPLAKMNLGSSNVNIIAAMQTTAGQSQLWTAAITNLSADTWGISFSSVTNRWRFQSWMYGTNAPSVLTNNTLLRLNGESEGTNTLVTYEYFAPGL